MVNPHVALRLCCKIKEYGDEEKDDGEIERERKREKEREIEAMWRIFYIVHSLICEYIAGCVNVWIYKGDGVKEERERERKREREKERHTRFDNIHSFSLLLPSDFSVVL